MYSGLRLAFIFIFTGFTAKLGLVPMYTAGIDAKDKAPSPAGALLSSVLMNVGFVGIFRFYTVVANSPIHQLGKSCNTHSCPAFHFCGNCLHDQSEEYKKDVCLFRY